MNIITFTMILTYISSRLEVLRWKMRWKMRSEKILEVYLKKNCNIPLADVSLQIIWTFSKHPFYVNLLNFLLTSAGIGRTGIFIALSNSIEQMNIEGAVNIFQIAKKMREQRSTKIMTRVRKFQSTFCLFALWLKIAGRDSLSEVLQKIT